jgi:hypothetical protein
MYSDCSCFTLKAHAFENIVDQIIGRSSANNLLIFVLINEILLTNYLIPKRIDMESFHFVSLVQRKNLKDIEHLLLNERFFHVFLERLRNNLPCYPM